MKRDNYIIIGQFRGGYSGRLGVNLYKLSSETFLPEEGVNICGDIAAGVICVNEAKDIVYAVHEKEKLNGRLGGGSCVYTFLIDREKGALEYLSAIPTLLPSPSGLALSLDGRYLLVSHNGGVSSATKIFRNENGEFASETVFDDAALVLLELNKDGIPVRVTDAVVTENDGEFGPRAVISEPAGRPAGIFDSPGTASHQHSVMMSPDGNLFAVCDIGLGKIYTFTLDAIEGKLELRNTYLENLGYGVRYSAFHPEKPFLYVNCEFVPKILIYEYDPDAGTIKKKGEAGTLFEGGNITTGSKDIKIHPNGRTLYCSNTSDLVSVMRINDDGSLTLLETKKCDLEIPRALEVTPDGRFLFCGCNRKGVVVRFDIKPDGTLAGLRQVAENVLASSIRII